MVPPQDLNAILSLLNVDALISVCRTCKLWSEVAKPILQCKLKWKSWAIGVTYNHKYVGSNGKEENKLNYTFFKTTKLLFTY